MLSLQHIYKSFDDQQVLNDINLTIKPGEVVSLVGANGAGKTTLLRIIHGQYKPDSGQVINHFKSIAYIPQQLPLGPTISQSFASNIPDWRKQSVLTQIGLNHKDLSLAADQLSGGQRTRLSIATVLAHVSPPDCLLLDEPTNNLDQSALQWLESFVKDFKGGILLVSHDRAFINAVTNKVLELEDGQLQTFGGDYDAHLHQKQQQRQTEWDAYQQNINERDRLTKLRQAKVAQANQASKQSFNKIKHESRGGFNNSQNATERTAGQQIKAIESRLEQLGDLSRPESAKNYRLSLSGQAASQKLILQLADVNLAYHQQQILRSVSLSIYGQQRWHIQGPNGSGKTSLLKTAVGLQHPDSGQRQLGVNISLGYFGQDVDGLDYRTTALINLQRTKADSTNIFRQARALGLTEDDLQRLPDELSRGQQAKLAFAKLLLADHQLLVLDEPTNHLDLPTRQAIEAALQNYHGALLVASHDRYFIDALNITNSLNLNPCLTSQE